MRIRKRKKQTSSNSQINIQPQLQPRPFAPQSPASETVAELQTFQEKTQQPERSFADVPIFTPERSPDSIPIQAKLTIGQPNDKYEQEADRVAHQVVHQINTSQTQGIQKEAAPEEKEEENVQPKLESETFSPQVNGLMLKPDRGDMTPEAMTTVEVLRRMPSLQTVGEVEGNATAEFESSLQSTRGSGQPLADKIRQPMEKSFGTDFSQVKVHTDPKSDRLNQSIQAKAFTTGTDIYFKQGQYNPSTRGGQELIAHELTHVMQQNGNGLQRKSEPIVQRLIYEDKDKDKTINPAKAKKYLVENGISENVALQIVTKYTSLQNPQDIIGLENLLDEARNIDNSDAESTSSDTDSASVDNAGPSLLPPSLSLGNDSDDGAPGLGLNLAESTRLWQNNPSTFTTHNTENNLGNSSYTVTPTALERIARINIDPHRQAEDQVFQDHQNRHVCFVSETVGDKIYDYVHESDFPEVESISESGNTATIRLTGINEQVTVNLNPTVGEYVIDFDWDANLWVIESSTFHYGHAVHETPAPQRRRISTGGMMGWSNTRDKRANSDV